MDKMKALVFLLIVALLSQPFSMAVQSPEARKDAIKTKLNAIPVGKNIEVVLLQEGSKKIKGKLTLIAADSFEISTVQSGVKTRQTIAFGDVMSVKKRGMRRTYKILIGVGAFMGIVIAAAAASDRLSY